MNYLHWELPIGKWRSSKNDNGLKLRIRYRLVSIIAKLVIGLNGHPIIVPYLFMYWRALLGVRLDSTANLPFNGVQFMTRLFWNRGITYEYNIRDMMNPDIGEGSRHLLELVSKF